MTENWQRLYGAADGRWLILQGGNNTAAAPRISVAGDRDVELRCLGAPLDIVNAVYLDLYGPEADASGLASLLGVSRQSAQRYLQRRRSPALSDLGWRRLVRAYLRAQPRT